MISPMLYISNNKNNPSGLRCLLCYRCADKYLSNNQHYQKLLWDKMCRDEDLDVDL